MTKKPSTKTASKAAKAADLELPPEPKVLGELKLREAYGYLFIGDPHVSSRKPARRKDANFAETVMKKLRRALEIANEKLLIPVILGDLLDRAWEEDETVKTRLLRTLKKSWTVVIILVGNHDKHHAMLTDSDTLSVIAEADNVVKVVKHSGPVEEFLIGPDKVRVGLGGTPYGQDLPTDVRPWFPECRSVIWLSHADLEFEGAYPGSKPFVEIRGCRLVVNGHMHLTKAPVQVGETMYLNPGNITRWAVDAIDHVPRVWELNSSGEIIPHDLPYEKDIFDLTGRLVEAISPGEKPSGKLDDEGSVFVDLLHVEASMEMGQSSDGSILLEEIEAKFQSEETPIAVQGAILDLHKRAANAPERSS